MRQRPDWYLWMNFTPPGRIAISRILNEIYGARCKGYARLVAAGVRLVIEHIMIHQGGAGVRSQRIWPSLRACDKWRAANGNG